MEREIKDIVMNRAKEEMAIDLLSPYFDISRIKLPGRVTTRRKQNRMQDLTTWSHTYPRLSRAML